MTKEWKFLEKCQQPVHHLFMTYSWLVLLKTGLAVLYWFSIFLMDYKWSITCFFNVLEILAVTFWFWKYFLSSRMTGFTTFSTFGQALFFSTSLTGLTVPLIVASFKASCIESMTLGVWKFSSMTLAILLCTTQGRGAGWGVAGFHEIKANSASQQNLSFGLA